MIECLISIIFHVEEEFQNYYDKFIWLLIDQTKGNNDTKSLGVKRVAIDALYSLGVHCKKKMMDQREEILTILDVCRTDKNQPVRAAAQQTRKLLKEMVGVDTSTVIT